MPIDVSAVQCHFDNKSTALATMPGAMNKYKKIKVLGRGGYGEDLVVCVCVCNLLGGRLSWWGARGWLTVCNVVGADGLVRCCDSGQLAQQHACSVCHEGDSDLTHVAQRARRGSQGGGLSQDATPQQHCRVSLGLERVAAGALVVNVAHANRGSVCSRFVESFVENGKLCIVMGYADGGDLKGCVDKRKKSRGHFSEDEVMGYFVQICLALNHMHSRHILHRDLKSQVSHCGACCVLCCVVLLCLHSSSSSSTGLLHHTTPERLPHFQGHGQAG